MDCQPLITMDDQAAETMQSDIMTLYSMACMTHDRLERMFQILPSKDMQKCLEIICHVIERSHDLTRWYEQATRTGHSH